MVCSGSCGRLSRCALVVTIPPLFPGFTSQEGEVIGPRRTRLGEVGPAIGACRGAAPTFGSVPTFLVSAPPLASTPSASPALLTPREQLRTQGGLSDLPHPHSFTSS